MSGLLKPFTGSIPASEFAHRVVGPPASMLSAEQQEAARQDSLSFRYALGRGARASRDEAVAWLHRSQQRGALRPVGPTVLVYRQMGADGVATGILADISLEAYNSGRVKRHERTVGKTQRKMERYFRSTRVYGNPVALAHRPHPAVAATIDAAVGRAADSSFTTADGVAHQLWVVEAAAAAELCEAFDTMLYITDGHHRLAAAAAVTAEEGWPDGRFPAGLFSTTELRLRSFARCVVDPSLDAGIVIDQLRTQFGLEEVSKTEARPRSRGELGMQVRGRYFRLRLGDSGLSSSGALDVDLLQDLILRPVLGINDSSADRRLSFVADLPHGDQTDIEADAWFLPFPLLVSDVMSVADSGRVMPPKSTWFAPKMPSGLAVRLLD